MFYFLVNPYSRSGATRKRWAKIQSILRKNKIPYKELITKNRQDATKLTRSLMKMHEKDKEPIKLVILGGDGTINEVINGITDFDKVLVGYLPGGSGGDFAKGLKLDDDCVLMEHILCGEERRRIDVGKLTFNSVLSPNSDNVPKSFYFTVSAGMGFDAAVCEAACNSKTKKILNKVHLGKLTYLAIALKQICNTPKNKLIFEIDDHISFELNNTIFATSMIHSYEGGGFKFCPDADDTDGQLDICAFANMSLSKILGGLPIAFLGLHKKIQGVHLMNCQKLHLQSDIPLWIHTDGEVYAKSSDIKVECLQKKLRLLI